MLASQPLSYRWRADAEEHELSMVPVPGTHGTPFRFDGRDGHKLIEVPDFYIASTPVTQALWLHVMGSNPAIRRDLHCPVENVSWYDVTGPNGFLERLNASTIPGSLLGDNPALRFRLPSESEWEYAARGGPDWQDGYAYSGSNDPDAVAWYGPRWTAAHELAARVLGWRLAWRWIGRFRLYRWKRSHSHPVGRKAANQLGAYDMSGNVWEWCQDVSTNDLTAVPGDGAPYRGPGTERRLRGGCHHNWNLHCTVAWRYGIAPEHHDSGIGFRVALAAA